MSQFSKAKHISPNLCCVVLRKQFEQVIKVKDFESEKQNFMLMPQRNTNKESELSLWAVSKTNVKNSKDLNNKINQAYIYLLMLK